MSVRHLVLAAALALAGCAGRVSVAAPAHGNLLAHIAERDAPRRRRPPPPASVIMIEDGHVRAIDPRRARTQWVVALEVTGHPVANDEVVVVPVRDHRLVGLDRASGKQKFSVELPGEALTGLAIAGGWIAASVLGGDDGTRSQLVALAAEDGHVRWRRRAQARFGVPEVVGHVIVAPLGRQAVAFAGATGRELARIDIAGSQAFDRLVRVGDAWFAAGGDRWVALSPGGGRSPHAFVGTYAEAFPATEGFDVGHGEGERLRLWVRPSTTDATWRDAILLVRRTVISLRLDGDGRPVRARWIHTEDLHELVALQPVGDRVIVVREDGAIVQLDAVTGELLGRIVGGEPVRGALVLGPPARGHSSASDEVDPDELVALLGDPDPRLLPAQRLAADLLWRSEDAEVREHVNALAAGRLRGGTDAASMALRDHALALGRARWGRQSREDTAAVLATLRRRPSFTAAAGDLAPAVRAAVRSGSPEVVGELAELLLHPGTTAGDLVEIVRALGQLGDGDATAALATFVLRYHADTIVVYESSAVTDAAAALLARARRVDDAAAAGRARAALGDAVRDPLCEPTLRAFILRGLDQLPPASREPPTLLSASL